MNYDVLMKIVAGFILLLLLILLVYLRERKLKKDIEINQTLLEAIINNIPNPMFYKDREGVFKNVNDAFAKDILGLSKQEIIGKTLYDLKDMPTMESIELHEEHDALLYKNHTLHEYDSKVKMNDGTVKDFKITKTIFNCSTTGCMGYIGIMSDITELKNKEKKLQLLASVDPLTKLYNRRYFSKTSAHLFNLAKRDAQEVSLLMLDIDDFKKINDSYGHKVGDDVIIMISNILQAMSRESDIVARFGGEEFIMFLPKTDMKGALIIAEKIRHKVEESSLNILDGDKINFTISIGASEINFEEENDIEAAIKRADDALYEAKKSGKNRVCNA